MERYILTLVASVAILGTFGGGCSTRTSNAAHVSESAQVPEISPTKQISKEERQKYYREFGKVTWRVDDIGTLVEARIETAKMLLDALPDGFPFSRIVINNITSGTTLFTEHLDSDLPFSMILCSAYFGANQRGKIKPPPGRPHSERVAAMNQQTDIKLKELLVAIANLDTSGVERLIRIGANVNARDEKGWPVLFYAASNRQTDGSIVTAMLKAGAEVNATESNSGTTALLIAIDPGGTPGIIRALLEGGADPNAADLGGDTPLMRTAGWDDAVILQMLLSKGADPNKRQRQGRTALMIGAKLGHAKAVEILLKGGADPRVKDGENRTALQLAEERYAEDARSVNNYERNNRRRILNMLRGSPENSASPKKR